jgi:hypothetical protein
VNLPKLPFAAPLASVMANRPASFHKEAPASLRAPAASHEHAPASVLDADDSRCYVDGFREICAHKLAAMLVLVEAAGQLGQSS